MTHQGQMPPPPPVVINVDAGRDRVVPPTTQGPEVSPCPSGTVQGEVPVHPSPPVLVESEQASSSSSAPQAAQPSNPKSKAERETKAHKLPKVPLANGESLAQSSSSVGVKVRTPASGGQTLRTLVLPSLEPTMCWKDFQRKAWGAKRKMPCIRVAWGESPQGRGRG